MYIDETINENYPKTLMIRNHQGGFIWQIYHVQKKSEALKIVANAYRNGFHSSTLEEYQPERDETWPDWRETCDKEILE